MAFPPNIERCAAAPDSENITPGTRVGAGRANGTTAQASADCLWQPSLFDEPAAEPHAPAPLSGVRCSLDADSWVDLIPHWLPEPEALFATLLETAPWEQRERWMYDRMVIEPRLTAEVRRLADAPHR